MKKIATSGSFRFLWLLVVFLLTSTFLFAQSQSGTLSGSVIDSTTGRPMPGVSVFLNSTSKGTVTRADGSFVLPGIPPGRYELIVSAIGYQTFITSVNSHSLPLSLKINLHVKASELEAVTVEPYLKDGWKQWGKFFLDNFIGTTENAASCTLKNKEVLRFHFYKKSNRLSVTAIDPLIIVNKGLGYNLEYRLEGFVCDFSEHMVSYSGYPLFQDMSQDDESRREKWLHRRETAYLGSMMHFMRSLYKDELRQDGFIIEHEVQIPNREKQRVKVIYHIGMPTDSIPIDTLHHYWEVMRQPDFFIQKVKGPEGLLTIHPDANRVLFFTGKCTVIYGNGAKGIAYQESAIQLLTGTAVAVGENGSYYPGQEVLTLGNWSKTETIGNLLPRDYEMYGSGL